MTEETNRLKLVHITTVPITLRFFHGQVGYLKSHGMDVSAVSSPGELLDRFHEREDVAVYPIVMARQPSPRSDIVSLYRIWALLRKLRPDIVHSHTPKAGLLGTIAARLAGIDGVVLSLFGLPQMGKSGLSRAILDFMTRLACRLADRIWCDSFSMRDYVVSSGLCPADKVMVLCQGSVGGVDAKNTFSPEFYADGGREKVRAGLGIATDSLALGFVGRIVGDKGINELAFAWRNLREQFPSLHLILVGPLEDKDPLLPEAGQLLRLDERVHFIGFCEDTASYFAAMDVFVMPSYREGFGVTNIEAAAMALPVVSTAIPGCVDSVEDGMTGTLVPARDAKALESAIAAYCSDAELRAKHGQAGRARALKDFRPESVWEALRCEYVRLSQRK